MQMNYKDSAEIAAESGISKVFADNNYQDLSKRITYDLVTIGIGAAKTRFTDAEGIILEYVDPANMVWSYTEDPNFRDCYYFGEVRTVHINELEKQFPHLDTETLKEISENGTQRHPAYSSYANRETDSNSVQVLYFEFKTMLNQVWKVKHTGTGGEKAIEKDDSFNPPTGLEGGYERVDRKIEVLFEGAFVLGTEMMLKWEIAENQIRPKAAIQKVKSNYSVCAPRMYNGRIESLVGRITGFANMIQKTHLKLQQVISRTIPDGIYLDADGLMEIDLGNGTKYNPAEALKMFFQTGSVVGRSFTGEGDMNPGKVPIQELQTSSGNNKVQTLIATYNYYLQMIRDTTGLNEARDASQPDARALVGVQKLAAANSNTATRHIVEGNLSVTKDVACNIFLRISDVLEYSPHRDDWIRSLGAQNVGILDDLKELHLRDFAIHIDLLPDEEEQQQLEQNIQVALANGLIDLDDSIDIREVKNLKTANQLLKLAKRKKFERDQEAQQANIAAQAEANARQQEAAAQMEIQKAAAIEEAKQSTLQLEDELSADKLLREVKAKKELMQFEYEINARLEEIKAAPSSKDQYLEDRKDTREVMKEKNKRDMNREKMENKKFESSGNDVINGRIDLGNHEPR